MDPLDINEESVILDILKAIPYSNEHKHIIPKNIANNFRSLKKVKPTITGGPNVENSIYSFTLPDSGFLERLVLRITFNSSEDLVTDALGSRIFKKIVLKQGLKDIFTNSPSYIVSRINSEPVNKQKNYQELISPQFDMCTSNNVVYCPIFSSLFDVSNNNILLNYIKRLELQCTLGSLVDDVDVELICYIKNYQQPYYNSYIYHELQYEKNYFSYDTYNIQTPISSGATYVTIPLKGPFLIFALHNIIYNENYTNLNIDRMVLNCNGTDVLNIRTQDNGFIEPSFYQYNGSLLSYYFGSKDRTFHSGSINVQQGPWTMTIFMDQASTSTYTLNTSLEYFCILECDTLGNINKNILF